MDSENEAEYKRIIISLLCDEKYENEIFILKVPTLYLLNEKCKFKRMSSIDKIKFVSDNHKYNIKNCVVILRNLIENLKIIICML